MFEQFLYNLHTPMIAASIGLTVIFLVLALMASIAEDRISAGTRFFKFALATGLWAILVKALPIPATPIAIPQPPATQVNGVPVRIEIRYPLPIRIYREQMERCLGGSSDERNLIDVRADDYQECHQNAIQTMLLAHVIPMPSRPTERPSFQDAYNSCQGDWSVDPRRSGASNTSLDSREIRNQRIRMCGEIADRASR